MRACPIKPLTTFICRDGSKISKDILERHGVSNPKLAKFTEDWIAWIKKPQPERTKLAMALALGLHRDPSRARTHAFVQEVAHVPHARDPRYYFRAAHAGIFLLEDIADRMDRASGVTVGTAKKSIEAFWRQNKLKDDQRDSLSVVIVTHEPEMGTHRIDIGGYFPSILCGCVI